MRLAAGMLTKAGLGPERLECGCHWPFDLPVALDLARSGETPGPLHNNCSGKHAGFLCTAVHLGEETAGYVGAAHPVQTRAREAIEDLARRQRKKEKRSHRKGMTDSDDSATGLGETSAGADTPIAGFEESDESVTTATPVARRRLSSRSASHSSG